MMMVTFVWFGFNGYLTIDMANFIVHGHNTTVKWHPHTYTHTHTTCINVVRREVYI